MSARCVHRSEPVPDRTGFTRSVFAYEAPDVGDVYDTTTGERVPLRATTVGLARHLLAGEVGATFTHEVDLDAYTPADEYQTLIVTWAPLTPDHPAVLGRTHFHVNTSDGRSWYPVVSPFTVHPHGDDELDLYPNQNSLLSAERWISQEHSGADIVCALIFATINPDRFTRDWPQVPVGAVNCPQVPTRNGWAWPKARRKHLHKVSPPPPVSDTARQYIRELVEFRVEYGRWPHNKDSMFGPREDPLGEAGLGRWLTRKRRAYQAGRLGANLQQAIEQAGIPFEAEGPAGRDNAARRWTQKHNREPSMTSADLYERQVAEWASRRKLDLTVPPEPFHPGEGTLGRTLD